MVYSWVKLAVGALLTINFAAPLGTVVVNRQLWDEPMAVLAGNLSSTGMCLGISLVLIAAYDIAQLKARGLCQALQYCGFGFGIAFKMAETFMAIDQFVAVVHPLQHYAWMTRAWRWLFVATLLAWAIQPAFGMFAVLLELKTPAESMPGYGSGEIIYTECRWESNIAEAYAIFIEIEFLVFSLATAALFVYTGVVGHRTMVRIKQENGELGHNGIIVQKDLKFLDNFRAFKRVACVLALTATMDILSPTDRFVSRWYPMPELNGILHQLRALFFILEGWVYGLLNVKLRAAYKKTLCGRCESNTVEPIAIQEQH